MKTKKPISLLAIVLMASFLFAGCGTKKKAVKKPVQQKPAMQQQQTVETENYDAIDFSDPGDDEVGQDIQELDQLINETSPSEYNEDDLSEEALDAGLQ